MKFHMDLDRRGIVRGGTVTIHYSGETIFSFTHIEGNTLADEEVD
jgi:hypothetical protein